ncbi:MAG TPA: DUF3185 family protein [Lacunisphaera sp.]|nr:DUF3185 family protein [Lacunisphaera sp.]
MNKPLSIALLLIGILLLGYGLNAGDSFASETKEAITGTPTDRSMILIIAGVAGVVIGGLSTFFRRHN